MPVFVTKILGWYSSIAVQTHLLRDICLLPYIKGILTFGDQDSNERVFADIIRLRIGEQIRFPAVSNVFIDELSCDINNLFNTDVLPPFKSWFRNTPDFEKYMHVFGHRLNLVL